MKIDNLLQSITPTAKEVIIIVNKETIDSLIKELDEKVVSETFGTFEQSEGVWGIHKAGVKAVWSIYRAGINVYLIDEESIDENLFIKSLKQIKNN
ncbi:MAG TPA: hypothetical protein VKN14_14150 [Flavobacteriaceae bacterium]|nr:hypothetical protein [Flavobacteriaceae bacterium]